MKRSISSWEDRHRVFYALRDPVVKGFLLVLVVVAAVVLFLVLRGPGREAFTFGPAITRLPDVGSGAVIEGVPSRRGGSPAAVAREADRIAASNPTVAQLVRLGDGARVGSVGGSRARGSGTAWLGYKLKRPVAVDADLPCVVVPPAGPAHGTCVSPYAGLGSPPSNGRDRAAVDRRPPPRRGRADLDRREAGPSQPRRRKALPNLQRGPGRLRGASLVTSKESEIRRRTRVRAPCGASHSATAR